MSAKGNSATVSRGSDFATDSRLLMLSAFALLIGVLSTLGAAVLLAAIRFFTNVFFFGKFSLATSSPADNHLGLAVVAIPALGGLIVGLMARFGSEKIRGHGIPEAIEAILFGKSRMSPKIAILKPLSSGIAIGSGGPFGAEGPIIMTGGAVASLLAQAFHLTASERKALLVAGACAGMTAVFGTPLAAILLAVELLLFELRPRSLLPVALSCGVAGFLRPLWAGAGPLFPLQTPEVLPIAMLSCCVAGLASGALSALMTHFLYQVEDFFGRLRLHWMWWPALGGLVVGVGGFIQPRALGVGYDVIGDLLQHHLLLSAALSLLFVKAVIWAVALGSGTSRWRPRAPAHDWRRTRLCVGSVVTGRQSTALGARLHGRHSGWYDARASDCNRVCFWDARRQRLSTYDSRMHRRLWLYGDCHATFYFDGKDGTSRPSCIS